MRPNHNPLLEGKAWVDEVLSTVWMSWNHSAVPQLIGTGPSNVGIQPVVSDIETCNCVSISTHS